MRGKFKNCKYFNSFKKEVFGGQFDLKKLKAKESKKCHHRQLMSADAV
jgi:hypothetical protein